MSMYRKKPVVIEALRYTRDACREVCAFAGIPHNPIGYGEEECATIPFLEIETLEGTMRAHVGDYIIKGVKGEFYPCRADIFEATYELVGEQ